MMPRATLLRFRPQEHQQSGGVPSCFAIQICHSKFRVCKQKQPRLCREANPNPGSIIRLVVNNIMVRLLTCASFRSCCAVLDNVCLPIQTYRHAVIEPGARLNLVLGPNGEQRHLPGTWPRAALSVRRTSSVACAGTGKSSFVCAICVGLGGSLKVGSAAFVALQPSSLDLKGALES